MAYLGLPSHYAQIGGIVPQSSSTTSFPLQFEENRLNRDAMDHNLQELNDLGIVILHPKVARKSYGIRKRYFCPPPCIYRFGNGWRYRQEEMLRKGESIEGAQLLSFIAIGNSDQDMQQLNLNDSQRYFPPETLYISDSEKRKDITLSLKMFYGNGRYIGQFNSKKIKITSKPSKINLLKNADMYIASGTNIALFHSFGSEKIRYLHINNGNFCGSSTEWSAFKIRLVDDDKPEEFQDGYVHYGSTVKLISSVTGIDSPSLVIRKVDRKIALLEDNSPVLQLYKCAFYVKDSERMYLCFSHEKLIQYQAIPCPNEPNKEKIDNAACWNIIGTDEAYYQFYGGTGTSQFQMRFGNMAAETSCAEALCALPVVSEFQGKWIMMAAFNSMIQRMLNIPMNFRDRDEEELIILKIAKVNGFGASLLHKLINKQKHNLCDHRNFSIKQCEQLQNGTAINLGMKNVQCKICKIYCYSYKHLDTHMKVHREDKFRSKVYRIPFTNGALAERNAIEVECITNVELPFGVEDREQLANGQIINNPNAAEQLKLNPPFIHAECNTYEDVPLYQDPSKNSCVSMAELSFPEGVSLIEHEHQIVLEEECSTVEELNQYPNRQVNETFPDSEEQLDTPPIFAEYNIKQDVSFDLSSSGNNCVSSVELNFHNEEFEEITISKSEPDSTAFYEEKWNLSEEVVYTCEKCSKIFTRAWYLQLHMKSHRSRQYSCNVCSQIFSDKVDLGNHTKTHKFECYVCKTYFPTLSDLDSHINKHTACEQSNWNTDIFREILHNQPIVMVKNLDINSIEEITISKYEPDSTAFYEEKWNLSEKVVYTCIKCSRIFTRAWYLHLHMKSHRNRQYSCNVCSQIFNDKVDLGNHTKTHKFECYVCKTYFPTLSDLDSHINKHTACEQSNWNTDIFREMLHNQPIVMVKNLDINSIDLKSLADFDKRNRNSMSDISVTELPPGIEKRDQSANCQKSNELRNSEEQPKRTLRYAKCNIEQDNEFDPSDDSSLESWSDNNSSTADSDCTTFYVKERNLSEMRNKRPHLLETKKKRKRCGECTGCQKKNNCGECNPCKNVKVHAICKERRCEKLTNEKPTSGDFLSCNVCKKRCRDKKILERHIQIHVNGKFKCDICDIPFTKQTLTQHKYRFHGELQLKQDRLGVKSVKCKTCKLNCHNYERLERHMKIHTEGKYKCELCQIPFTRTALTMHQKRCHSDLQPKHSFKSVICTICKLNCRKLRRLVHHMKIHTEGKYKCEHCQIPFTKIALTMHQKRCHSDLQPKQIFKSVICTICKLNCRKLRRLEHHMKIHTEGKYKCEHCQIPFNRIALTMHQRRCHSDLQPKRSFKSVICTICKLNCREFARLERHMKIHTDGEFKCEICQIMFTKNALTAHKYRCHPELQLEGEEKIGNSQIRTPATRKRCGKCVGCVTKDNCGKCYPCKNVKSHAVCKKRRCETIMYDKRKKRRNLLSGKKRKRCGECIGCMIKDNCGECHPCKNDKSHAVCKRRRCEKLINERRKKRRNLLSGKKRKRCGKCIGCVTKDNCGKCTPCKNDKSHAVCKKRRCETIMYDKMLQTKKRRNLLPGKKRKRCGKCIGCVTKDNCGKCNPCKNDNNHRVCQRRRCEKLMNERWAELSSEKENKIELQKISITLYQCKTCKIFCCTKERLKRHQKLHERAFKCKICNIRFTKQSFWSHQKRHHPAMWEKPIFIRLQCDICKTICPSRQRLEQHMKVHSKGEFMCKICRIPFSETALAIHEIRHHPEMRQKKKKKTSLKEIAM